MAAPLVSDAPWALIEPLLPPEPPKPKGGRPRLDNRAALTGILFVLRSGIPWELLPVEMGCGSGMTCWRRLHEWHRAGVRERLHRVLLDRLGYANAINWERAAVDSAAVPAKRGRGDRAEPDGHRWVVERTLAWFARFRRLAVRYERRADIFSAFHHIAASLICWRFVQKWFC